LRELYAPPPALSSACREPFMTTVWHRRARDPTLRASPTWTFCSNASNIILRKSWSALEL